MLPRLLKSFEGGGKPQVEYRVHYRPPPKYALGKPAFESNGLWRLYEHNGRKIITLTRPRPKTLPYALADLSTDYRDGDIYFENNQVSIDDISYPLSYPLDELLMIGFLCHGRGLMLHGCGVINKGNGLAFLGPSGAGKSTMANLWREHTQSTLLGDDRLIVRKKDGRFWLWGTPWRGEANIVSPAGGPLKKIYFIKHAPQNYMRRLSAKESLSRLLITCFPTFWEKKGMEYAMRFGAALCQEVDTFELGVVPDKTIIDVVKQP